MSSTAPPIEVFNVLRQDADLVLCRSAVDTDGSSRLVLMPAAGGPSASGLLRLEQEWTHRDNLDAAWAARPLERVRHVQGPALMLSDPGGEPLGSLVDRPWDVGPFIRVAIGMATAIGHMHDRGLIHKDIKPANILVDVRSGQAWLTGFSIASRLPREQQLPESPEVIAGTLAYMAPEQTGRMNRSIDSRSDLYALGVTFYEMLTGALPFAASDAIEWIHCHIARAPMPPDQRVARVPAQLSAIVMRLLAKTAEERYQTAAGVEADLRRCLGAWETSGQIELFPLGAQDASDRLRIPERLYGREAETATLLAAFDRVAKHGGCELVLVSGYSGIGKSSVVNELQKVIVLPRGIFIAGKFDLRLRDIPYATFARGFQGLIRQILDGDPVDARRWRERLQEAVGSHGFLLTELMPELAQLIGIQPPVPALSGPETQARFQAVFQRFVGAFARAEHPLVVFIDDLQWLDPATLMLIEQLTTHPQTQHLLLIGAYRDNEVGPAHPLVQTLQRIRQTSANTHDIVLGPLSMSDTRRLVGDALRSEPAQVHPLVDLVHRKSVGNPFFAGQFLTHLSEEGLLWFDAGSKAWAWDLEEIASKSFNDDLVDLMARRLRRLPLVAQEALKLLACLGNHADFATLAKLHGASDDGMHAGFREAVRAGAVLAQKEGYRFIHDRVQEAAYALIPVGSRAEHHLRIGRLLFQGTAPDKLAENVFDIVNQMNSAAPSVLEEAEAHRVARLNLLAGQKAKGATAYASACSYLRAGVASIGEAGWQSCYDVAVELQLERAECELLNANGEQAALLIDEVLRRGRSKLERARAYGLRMTLQLMQSENAAAVGTARECLRMFGMELPDRPSRDDVQTEYDDMFSQLRGRPIESLVDLPLSSDPEVRAMMNVLVMLCHTSYYVDGNLHMVVSFRMVNLTLRHGTCDLSPLGFGATSIVLGPVFHRFADGERFGRLAVEVAERHNFAAQKAGANFLRQMASLWTRRIGDALNCLTEGLRSARETGEIVFAGYILEHRVTNLIARGEPLDKIWQETADALAFAEKIQFLHVLDVINDMQCLVAHLRGRPNDVPIDEAELDARIAKGGIPLVSGFRWVTQLQREFLLGDPARAVEYAERAKPLLRTFRSHIQSADYCFYGSLAMAEVHASASPERQAELLEMLRENLSWLARWAQSGPSTFAHKYALAAAELARVEGRDAEALRLYDQAIRGAEEQGFVQDQALANELAGRCCLARGLDKFAQACLRDARDCYMRWGAFAKVAQLDARHGLGRPPPRGQRSTIEASLDGLDLEMILRMARSVSSEIVLDKLIEALMTVALEHAGADRGLLVLQQAGGQRIEAQASTGSHGVVVRQPGVPPTADDLPETVLEHVVRTRESVIIDDVRTRHAFSGDEYLQSRRPRSVLCVPLVKQTELIGILYLENTLASHVFTPARCEVLDLLSSQAAISLQNARLYTELQKEDSERRRAQEALRQSEERYALAVAGSNEGIYDWDLVTDRLYLAQRMQELVGLVPGDAWRPRDEWVGLVAIHPADVEPRRRGINALLAGETPGYDAEFRIVLPGGTRWFRQRGIALRDASGKAFRMVGTAGDITDQKLAQEERLQLERRLRQAQRFEAMGTLAGGIAHDFNNILGAILGFGERALRAADKDSRLSRDLNSIMAAGERGRALVDRILGPGHGVVNERTAVHVEKVVCETLDLLEAKLPMGVAIDAKLCAGRAAMVGDPTHVHQIVMNLGTNAVQAMPSGGSLMVSLKLERFGAAHTAHIGSVEAGDWLVLTVADSGAGIAPDIVDRIFDPFFTTKEAGVGTGLGLSLVLRLVTEIGGAIDVSSTPGAGSTFTVYLPREGDAPDAQDMAQSLLPRGNGQNLLVVDDEEPLMRLAIDMLEELGYAPVGFTSSRAALDAFGAYPDAFDAVIADERMPGMSGTTLIREVRRMRPAVPALLLSGYLRGPNPDGVRGEAPIEVLRKPLSVSELADVLARALQPSM